MWHWLVVLSFVLFMSCDSNTDEPEPEPSGEGTETEQAEADEELTQGDEQQTEEQTPDEGTGETDPIPDEVSIEGTGDPTEPEGDQPEPSAGEQALTELGALGNSVTAFFSRHSRLPANLEELTQSIDESEPIVTTIPNDPWGTAYRYEAQGNAFYLTSAGPDTLFDTDDDVTSVLAID